MKKLFVFAESPAMDSEKNETVMQEDTRATKLESFVIAGIHR